MAVRATAQMVGKIIKVKPAHDLTPFIEAANQLVDDLCLDSDYADSKLTRIETWLAAHFYAILAPRRKVEMVGGLQQTIESEVDLGLNVTRYGQMAMQLDTAGNLAASSNAMGKVLPRRIFALWLGKDPREEDTSDA